MSNNFMFLGMLCFGINFCDAQKVGIGTTSPVYTLDIKTTTNKPEDKAFRILNSDDKIIMSGRNNGAFGFGATTTDNPIAQMTVYGKDNTYLDTVPTFSIYAQDTKASFRTYINPKQKELNQSYMGTHSWILDKDSSKTTYKTANASGASAYGAFVGFHSNGTANGFFLFDSGTTVFASHRIDSSPAIYSSVLSGDRQIALLTSGSLRIEDEGKAYSAESSCTNPGVIAFDSTNDNFIGCVEIYSNGVKTGEMKWKKLNNN
ncbi:hypothetical protein [Riemerella anatipestifer]|nr:hypothetical protein [Riemerella anatipestifer]MCU7581062.1 hypothetical protein [Riemerella anatipestifer]MCW0478585.1 hypothetical protein [Riemerella anatipestifer]MCW0488603.1 hypothetical protein [Riemerella anatipestifer]MCW0497034.1 hypothetical protein [Riemerella anatipestifer]MCW0515095.1 hypothetical protein [Riemerella anatipestifer]